MAERSSCNGLCLSAADIGVPVPGIAYPHPGCEAHADPHDYSPGLIDPTACAQCGDTAEAEQHYSF